MISAYRRWLILAGLLFSFVTVSVFGALAPLQGLTHMEFQVEGVLREALVYIPASAATNSTPLVFVFHGHGGSSRNAARSFAIHRHWPEAISVYMQGLNTPGRLTDPEGKKPGWQSLPGAQGDRDLKFFDVVLEKLKHDYVIDSRRIYATGHSNGGGFTYLLWATRGEVFAAVAPSAAVASPGETRSLKPKPVMHLAGENDPLVKYAWQKLMMNAVRRINGCEPQGTPWGPNCTSYSSSKGTPVVTFIHPGGHEFQPEAPDLIVKFFKEHPAPEK